MMVLQNYYCCSRCGKEISKMRLGDIICPRCWLKFKTVIPYYMCTRGVKLGFFESLVYKLKKWF